MRPHFHPSVFLGNIFSLADTLHLGVSMPCFHSKRLLTVSQIVLSHGFLILQLSPANNFMSYFKFRPNIINVTLLMDVLNYK